MSTKDFWEHEKNSPELDGATAVQSEYQREAQFGNVLYGQWLPRIFEAETAEEMQRLSKGARNGDIMYTPAPYTPLGTGYGPSRLANPAALWQFRWSESVRAWMFVGGPPAMHTIETDEATTSTTLVNLATIGPIITTAFPGVYAVEFGAETYNSTATGAQFVQVIVNGGGSARIDAQASAVNSADTGASSRGILLGCTIPNSVFQLGYATTAGTGQFRKRWLQIVPLRIA